MPFLREFAEKILPEIIAPWLSCCNDDDDDDDDDAN